MCNNKQLGIKANICLIQLFVILLFSPFTIIHHYTCILVTYIELSKKALKLPDVKCTIPGSDYSLFNNFKIIWINIIL